VVAISELGIATGRMLRENAAAIVGAAMLSVLIFPLLALLLRGRQRVLVRSAIDRAA